MAKLADLPAYACAEVVELADTHGSGPCAARHEGSNPSFGIGVGRRARTVQGRVG